MGVKKARDLDGWYKLNATLVHQGMQPVDVKALQDKPDSVDKRLKNRQLLNEILRAQSYLDCLNSGGRPTIRIRYLIQT